MRSKRIGRDDGYLGRGFTRCGLRPGYREWHLNLVLTLREAKRLIDKVSPFLTNRSEGIHS